MISVPPSSDDTFVHVPVSLDQAYLEGVLSRSLGRDIAISRCTTNSLCAGMFGGVSNSGSTVLRLSLKLENGKPLDVVAKILSPDVVNLFKPDCRFDSRVAEVAWARWWGAQSVSWVPVVYDTRADPKTREFWILQEYFPQVGWPGWSSEGPKGMGEFYANTEKLHDLFRQVALLHAYSGKRIVDLRRLFSPDGISLGHLCPPSVLLEEIERTRQDTSFLSSIGVTEDECRSLETYCDAIKKRPEWVDEWDIVCVTADWEPDNFGIRAPDGDGELVPFDWGTSRLAPMEEDMDVLLMRLKELGPETRKELLSFYLRVYADLTGRHIDVIEFESRLPWARFLVTLRYLLGHLEALRWVPHQTRSREFVHLFVGACRGLLEKCRTRPCSRRGRPGG